MTAPRTDTWMPLYVGDYLRKTMHLSTVEHGAYLLLIMSAWTNDGRIPASAVALANIAKVSPRQWKEIGAKVLAFWRLSDDGAHYVHGRVLEELERSQRVSEKRRQAGANGAAKRWQGDSNSHSPAKDLPVADASQIDRQSQSHNSPSESTSARGSRLPPELLDKVWSAAPPKARERSSRGDTSKALAAALKRGAQPDEIMAGLTAYWRSDDATKDNGAYAKGVHRMIADDRWRDWTSTALIPAGEAPDWPSRLRIWRSTEQWHHGTWGPSPGYPTCQCPPDLLTESERRGRGPERQS